MSLRALNTVKYESMSLKYGLVGGLGVVALLAATEVFLTTY